MEKDELIGLFKKYREGRCSEEERALLEAWYLEYNDKDVLEMSPRRVEAVGRQVFRELPGNHFSFLRLGLGLTAASVVIGVLVTVAVHFWVPEPRAAKVADIVPGSNKAVLTLSDGKRIVLDEVGNGRLTGNIVKSEGRLMYDGVGGSGNNVISVPRGGEWQVVLPDGSKVWLNSASELVYPASFAGQGERVVELKGEAYFEAAKDAAHPFLVKTGRQVVRVLGTHFNVEAYDGVVRTVLEEGKVQVTAAGTEKILVPGQEAVLSAERLSVDAADVEEALAWKNGYFRFNDEDIKSIMRRLSRWYDIEVIYETNTPAGGLNGRISRYKSITQVLRALEATQSVHFKVEGRRVTVLK
ncbi:FecR family protein [Mucilaginibacter calamicampi]|uniref:FecR family protein n=1 Tax=Mucilaginibacter calamicampi TaxID=1302352 RepID=A0ABW2YS46_9SPHI